MAGKTQLTLEKGAEAVVTKDGLQVTFNAAGGIEVTVNGKNIVVDQTGKVALEASRTNTPIAQKAHEVGERLKDGTVVIAVDPDTNTSLRVPGDIFGGKSDFYHQDGVVNTANAQSLHGHQDWRRVTDAEAGTLARAWNKVAPPTLQGSAAPWFWGASAHYSNGSIFRGGESGWGTATRDRYGSCPVPVVRSGPALS